MGNNLKTTLAEADARLVMKGYINDGTLQPDTLVREWPHIDATEADALVAGLEDDGTEASPQAERPKEEWAEV